MTSNRVIQDSDDEDDPLACDAQPPPPVTIRREKQAEPVEDDRRIQDDNYGNQVQDVNGSHGAGAETEGMGINFDDFLQSQSQDVDTARLSSSQQRREERWIPSGTGVARGSGSIGKLWTSYTVFGDTNGLYGIGFMMSEIGLAQRRLFDDDAGYAEQQVPPTAQVPESEPSGHMFFGDGQRDNEVGVEYNNDISYPEGYPEGYSAQVQVPAQSDMPHALYQDGEGYVNGLDQGQLVDNTNGHYYDQPPHTSISVSSYGHVGSSTSYNVFDSFKGSTGIDSENPIAMPHETIQTEPLHTPNRSKSMQPMLDSPHDTEPLSSLVSSNVGRSKSDNVGQQGSSLQRSSANAPDGLSASVAIEIPVVQERRDSKKKQPQPEDYEEDDELAAPKDHKDIHEDKPAKRKPGRPRSNVQFMDEDNSNEPNGNHEPVEIYAPPLESNDVRPAVDQNTQPEADEIQLVEVSIPKKPAEPSKDNSTSEREQTRFAEPTKPTKTTKEPKKKKLKRGKTTSVTVKRTYEPDVEDDVIWVDERQRPSIPDFQQDHEPTSIPTPDSISVVDEERDVKAAPMVEIPNPAPASVTEGDGSIQPEPVPAPKKRGRKRKKTSEQQPPEEASAETNGHTPAQPEPNNTISVVLDGSAIEPNHNDNVLDNSANTQGQEQPPAPNTEPEPTSASPETPKKQHPTPDHFNKQQPSYQDTSTKPHNNDNDNTHTTTNNANKGPDKHSPIAGTSKVPYRVGLSRRARIAPLLKMVKR